ncbi:hypothetical protein BDR03DRAFT_948103 [Suillus americanus]|nr:hypothetical protein BDR03DRAFT_948103 [Suillus americanus]
MNPSMAIQSTIEGLDSLVQSLGAAQAELINCILRASQHAMTWYEQDTLDNKYRSRNLGTFTNTFAAIQVFKCFRASLSEPTSRLVRSATDVGAQYTSDRCGSLR